MNPCELTASITALANVIACKLPDEQLGLAAAVLTQLADTLATIAVQRAYCSSINSASQSASTEQAVKPNV